MSAFGGKADIAHVRRSSLMTKGDINVHTEFQAVSAVE